MAYTSVKISANSSDYQSQMKSAAAQMKVLSAEYTTAATKAKLFGSETDSLKAKAESLTQKITVQKSIVKLNSEQQEKLTKKLSDQKTKQEELKSKIDAAKEAYEKSTTETGKNSEQSKKLKEELEKLEKEFTATETAIGKTETTLANQTVKTEKSKTALMNMEAELKDVNEQLKNHKLEIFAKACDTAGEKMENFGKKMSVVSTGLVTFAAASGKMAIDFENDIAKVSTIMDDGVMSVDDMSDAILDLSNETGIAAGDIADNVYNAISAGQKTGDAVEFVRESTKLATAGFAESGSTLDVLTTILNAYGLEADKVTEVSDMLIQTQNLGKTTVAELSSAMGKVIPTANANGVALDQLCTGYAIMTANGVATAESTTYMNSMLNELGKTGSTTDVILREKTGKSFSELMASGSSLADVLDIINGAAKEQNLSMGDMFSSAEAAKAGLILLGNGADSFNGTLGEMRNSTGATDKAFDKMKTTSYDIKIALNELKNTTLQFGKIVMTSAAPVVDEFTEKVHSLSEWFGNLDESQQQTILKVGLVVAAIGPLSIGFGKVAKGISDTVTTGQKFVSGAAKIITKITAKTAATAAGTAADTAGTAATAAHTAATTAATTVTGGMTVAQTALNAVMKLCPIIMIVTLIGGLIAAGVALYKNWDTVKEKLSELWGSIKEKFNSIKETITGAFTKAKEAVANKVKEIGDSVKNSTIGQATTTVFNGVKDTVHNVMTAATETAKEKLRNMKTAYEENGGGIKGVVAAGWEGIKGYYTAGFTFVDNLSGGKLTEIKEKFSGKISEIKTNVSEGWENMKTTVTTKMTEWKTNASNKLTEIKTDFSSKVSEIKNNVSTSWENMKTTVTTKMTEWKNNASNKLTELKTGFSTKVSEIKSKWSTDFINIKDKATSLMETAKSNVSTKLNNMKTAYTNAGGGIKGIVSASFTGVKDTMNSLMSQANNLTGGKLDDIKSAFFSKMGAAKTTVSSVLDDIRGAFSSKLESARSTVSSVIEKIKGVFNFKWSLPHLNLPHISVNGGKAPYGIGGKGSLPSFSIEWYKNGGIMTNPTVFGINGSNLMVGGEAGAEAILPLAEFYKKLNNILDKKLDAVQKSNIVYVTNHTYIDGDEVASRTVSRVDAQMVTDKRKRR